MLIAGVLALFSLVGLILSFTSGLATAGIDGLFIIFVCLLTLAIFGLMALSLAAKAGILPVPSRHRHAQK